MKRFYFNDWLRFLKERETVFLVTWSAISFENSKISICEEADGARFKHVEVKELASCNNKRTLVYCVHHDVELGTRWIV